MDFCENLCLGIHDKLQQIVYIYIYMYIFNLSRKITEKIISELREFVKRIKDGIIVILVMILSQSLI